MMHRQFWIVVLCAKFILTSKVCEQLGSPPHQTIEQLEAEISPERFYHDYVHKSIPFLFRSASRLWQNKIAKWSDLGLLSSLMGELHGIVYDNHRPADVDDYSPLLDRAMKFNDFLAAPPDRMLYWDAVFPTDNAALQYLPMPFFLQCRKFVDAFATAEMKFLFNKHNATSVYHYDTSDNLFFQIAGTKSWLIANYTFTYQSYADGHSIFSNLSPIDPKCVDVEKFPLAKNIEFFRVDTVPGDVLYVPQNWWHYVASRGETNMGMSFFINMFEDPYIDDRGNVTKYMFDYAEYRRSCADTIFCPIQHAFL